MSLTDRVRPEPNVPLAPLTTLGVGGSARWFVCAQSAHQVLQAWRWAEEQRLNIHVIGGGSNIVVSDEGFDGVMLQIGIRECELAVSPQDLRVEAAAGERWDALVTRTVDAGFGGFECLSGIPGSVGGTPIQNVGAYGQEVGPAIELVTAIDTHTDRVVHLSRDECEFGYRQSRFKGRDIGRFLVTNVTYRLRSHQPLLSYPDVQSHLERYRVMHPTVADVRKAVLAIRRAKGMVIDLRDTDTRSVGSFFVNPIVSEAVYQSLGESVSVDGDVPAFRMPDGHMKVPAAWLIQHAGFAKGHGKGAAGISTKHPLAIVNRGGATAREIVDLALEVKQRVANVFGIRLVPEPVFIGFGADERITYLQKAI